MKRFLILFLPLILSGCGILPSKEKAARIYESEHRDRRVVSVEERQEGERFQTKVFFDITYTTAKDSTPKKDSFRYHRAAEGWVRSPE